MVRYAILDEYENGCKAIRGEDECHVLTAEGDRIELGSSSIGSNERRARLYAALRMQHGDIPLLDDPETIPLKIALAGKPAIASYLYAAHRDTFYDSTEGYRGVSRLIADLLDVRRSTVPKYHRRTLNEVEKQRVGGAKR